MTGGFLAFSALAASPLGGLLAAIPFGVFKLGYPAWFVIAAGVPLAYLQVIAVDVGWNGLLRVPAWRRLIEKRRSGLIERVLQSRGGFWITFAACPFVGPWLVMAVMRYAGVPHQRVALPIALSLLTTAASIWAVGALGWAVTHAH